MDMKKILQAMDGVSTKPVEGADSMARFLRVVKEAEINQVPAMPDIAGLQAGQSKDLGNGSNVTVNADGTVSYQGGWGTYIYNAQGQHVKTQSPSMAGYSQETDPTGNVTQQNYSQGPMNIQKGPEGTTANYQLGADNLQTTVQENSLNKFLSIVDKNNVSILSEGAGPHRVALPVQMAMQHYQQPTTKTQPRERLIDKYFVEAETNLTQRKEEKRAVYNQYAKTIANRVLMKEGAEGFNTAYLEKAAESNRVGRYMISIADARAELARRVGSQDPHTEPPTKPIPTGPTGYSKEYLQKAADPERFGRYLISVEKAQELLKQMNEAPIAMDPAEPNNPTIHNHQKANTMTLKGRIMSARAQLQELAELSESDSLLVWEQICKKAKGGMFMGLEQNLEQIRHGIEQLAAKRKQGGRGSRGITPGIGEGKRK
jgi:hypothetical protein